MLAAYDNHFPTFNVLNRLSSYFKQALIIKWHFFFTLFPKEFPL